MCVLRRRKRFDTALMLAAMPGPTTRKISASFQFRKNIQPSSPSTATLSLSSVVRASLVAPATISTS